MTSSVDTESETDARLRKLVAHGFQFMQSTGSDGEVAALVGVRGHDDVIDVIQLQSEDQVVATRMPADEDNIFSPRTVRWQTSGPVCEVIDELLDLPDERTPGSLIVPGHAAGF